MCGGAARDLLSSYSALNCSFSLTLSISALHEKPPTSPPPLRGAQKQPDFDSLFRLKDDTLRRPTHDDEITHTKLDCFLTEIRDINNEGFSVTSDMQSTIHTLVSLKGRQELAKINLAPVPSPKITAERTVFISRLGRHIGDRPAIEIQNELIKANPNINNIQVHKIKHYYHIIKEVYGDTKTADAFIRDGLYAFHTKIAASQCNLQTPRQHGFRKNRGTHTATAILNETIATAFGNGNKVNVVLEDISKAFDKVWHDELKLTQANFPTYLVRINSYYLENRTAAIRIGTFLGQKFPLLSGVPQGGYLSPTLFALYTADLPPPLRK